MAWEDLAAAKPPPEAKVYLDTSALIALAHFEGGKKSEKWVVRSEATNGALIADLLKKVRAEKGAGWVTPFQFQEAASMIINRARAKASNGVRWSAYKTGDPVAAKKVDAEANAKALEFLGWAVNACKAASVEVTHYVVLADKAIARALSIRLAHRALLQKYPGLDSMDAMHLVIGAELGISLFVTLDRGWTSVAEAGGYCPP